MLVKIGTWARMMNSANAATDRGHPRRLRRLSGSPGAGRTRRCVVRVVCTSPSSRSPGWAGRESLLRRTDSTRDLTAAIENSESAGARWASATPYFLGLAPEAKRSSSSASSAIS